MHPVIWFCLGGGSFFVGVLLLLVGILISFLRRGIFFKVGVYLLALVGAFLIFVSGAAFAVWLYAVWIGVVVCWLVLMLIDLPVTKRGQKVMGVLAACLCIGSVFVEVPYCIMPTLEARQFDTLYVIGDSISAGLGNSEEQTWPRIFRDEHSMNVSDRSRAGATVESALRRQVSGMDSEDALVLIEIGGNDLIGVTSTPCEEFEKDLRGILDAVTGSGRLVVMLELPVLPWQREYGRIQRRLAKEFEVVLVPKRFLVGVFAGEGATSDGAHLTAKGQRLMAERMWETVGYVAGGGL